MTINNPKTGESIETPCRGCMCHELAMQFGDLVHGCCGECGCPKNIDGWNYWKQQHEKATTTHDKR